MKNSCVCVAFAFCIVFQQQQQQRLIHDNDSNSNFFDSYFIFVKKNNNIPSRKKNCCHLSCRGIRQVLHRHDSTCCRNRRWQPVAGGGRNGGRDSGEGVNWRGDFFHEDRNSVHIHTYMWRSIQKYKHLIPQVPTSLCFP